jgi:hypothetical protein
MPDILDRIDLVGNPGRGDGDILDEIDVVGNRGGRGPRDGEVLEGIDVVGQIRKKSQPKHLRYPLQLSSAGSAFKNVVRFTVYQQVRSSGDGPGATPFLREVPEQYLNGGRTFPVSAGGFALGFLGKTSLLNNVTVAGVKIPNIGTLYEDLYGIGINGIEYFTQGEAINYGRRTLKLESTITLYMPDTVLNQDTHDYQPISVNAASGRAGLYTAGNPVTLGGTGSPLGRTEMLFELAGRAGIFGSRATEAALAGLGYALNPMLEMTYGGSQPRKFLFQFRFSPRNRQEAEEVLKIIKTFRFHSYSSNAGAPDDPFSINSGTRYLIPPDHFEIQFMRMRNDKLEENLAMPRVTTCMLTSVNTNYAAMLDSFTTFRDGTPVSISLDLEFVESVILTQNDIKKGY